MICDIEKGFRDAIISQDQDLGLGLKVLICQSTDTGSKLTILIIFQLFGTIGKFSTNARDF